MGYYLQIDTQEMKPLASTTGWGDVIRWVETLPVSQAKCLHHLTTYGWENDPAGTFSELDALSKIRPPASAPTKDTLKNLMALLKDNQKAVVISVTDGMS